MSSTSSFSQLLSIARNGSSYAQGMLFEWARGKLLPQLRRDMPDSIQSKASGSDIFQDGVSQAVQCFSQFRGETEEEFLSWMRTILHNSLSATCRAYFSTSKRSVQKEVAIDAMSDDSGGTDWVGQDDQSPISSSISHEEARGVRGILEQMEPEQKEVLEMRFFLRMEYKTIAGVLRISEEAARKRVTRSMRAFSKLWQQTHGEFAKPC